MNDRMRGLLQENTLQENNIASNVTSIMKQYKQMKINIYIYILLFEGSWHTRGHYSSLGLELVIDAHTTFVVDFIVLSKLCKICAKMFGQEQRKSNKIQTEEEKKEANSRPKICSWRVLEFDDDNGQKQY